MKKSFFMVKTDRKLNTPERYECQAMTQLEFGSSLTIKSVGEGE
jgi:hypothetical protein